MPSLNARPSSKLQEWLHEITEALAAHDNEHPESPSAPFGINLIVHKTNERHEHDLEVITKYKVPFVITSLGARPEVNDAVHSYGGIVMHDVINNAFAHKAIEKGADGLIAVAAGAGGHAGTKSPFALIQEIRQWFDGPLALSGSIATGSSILAAQALGADFAYIGSAFIATEEALAKDTYKDAIVDCNSDDIVYTNLFTGVHGNYLKPSIINAGLDPDNLPVSDASKMNLKQEGLETKWQSVQTASTPAPAAPPVVKNTEAKAWRDVWGCGQGIGAISKISSTAEFVEQLSKEYMDAKARICAL